MSIVCWSYMLHGIFYDVRVRRYLEEALRQWRAPWQVVDLPIIITYVISPDCMFVWLCIYLFATELSNPSLGVHLSGLLGPKELRSNTPNQRTFPSLTFYLSSDSIVTDRVSNRKFSYHLMAAQLKNFLLKKKLLALYTDVPFSVHDCSIAGRLPGCWKMQPSDLLGSLCMPRRPNCSISPFFWS